MVSRLIPRDRSGMLMGTVAGNLRFFILPIPSHWESIATGLTLRDAERIITMGCQLGCSGNSPLRPRTVRCIYSAMRPMDSRFMAPSAPENPQT